MTRESGYPPVTFSCLSSEVFGADIGARVPGDPCTPTLQAAAEWAELQRAFFQPAQSSAEQRTVRAALSVVAAWVLVCVPGVAAKTALADTGPILIVAPASTNSIPFQVGDTPEGEHTGFRDVIEKDELQKAGTSVAQVIASESGVQFRQSGGAGSFSSVSLRGASAEQVNVYVDGVLLNEASGGGVNLGDIELMQAERIDVYRGTVPAQLGNSAIGGAINVTTARAVGAPGLRLLAGVGSFGSRRLSTLVSTSGDRFLKLPVIVSFSHRESANDFPFINDNGTAFNRADDTRERRYNAATRSTSGFIKTGQRLRGGARLEHVLQAYDRREGLADWRNRGNALFSTRNLQLRSTLTSEAASGGWSSLYGAFVSWRRELLDDSDSGIGVGSQYIETGTRVVGLRAYAERVQDTSSLSFSVKGRREASGADDLLDDQGSRDSVRLRSDLQLQYSHFMPQGNGLLSVGVSGFSVDDDYDAAATPRSGYDTSALLPYAGVRFEPHEQLTIIANASLQKRVPSFTELFGNQGVFKGNAQLTTETSRNVDVGLQWRSAASGVFDLQFELALFHNRQNDLITRVYNAQGIGRAENISRASISGIELSQLFAHRSGIEFDANVTVQESVNESNISGFTDKQLPGEAAIDATFTTRYRTGRWKAEYEYRVNTDRYYDSANLLPAAEQRVHSIALSRRWRDWQLDLQLTNLTDDNHEDFNGYPKPGRAGFVSVLYRPSTERN